MRKILFDIGTGSRGMGSLNINLSFGGRVRGFMYFQGISFPRLNRDRKDMEEIETEIEGNKDESETAFELMISFWF